MEKTKFQELNQLTRDNRAEKRIGNGRRNGQERIRESYPDANKREELRREYDKKKAEEISNMGHEEYPAEDKRAKPGESIDLFKNHKWE